MALYHFSVSTVSRSNNGSAMAAAAYRSGERLVDVEGNIMATPERRSVGSHRER